MLQVRNPNATPSALRLACEAMGTRFECVLAGDQEPNLRAAAEAAFAEIESLHSRWSYFSSTSLVSRINQAGATRRVPLDTDTLDLLRLALNTWQDTEGCFDITIAPLMRRWGFRPLPNLVARASGPCPSSPTSSSTATCPTPDPATPRWGSQHLSLDTHAHTLAFTTPGIEIDLGAIAKGAALDAAASIIRDAGVTSALLHGGTSSVIAIGTPPDSPRGWPIRLGPDPSAPVVHLYNAALGVSAHHGRTADAGDLTVGHIIDPRTGEPGLFDSTLVGSPSRHGSGYVGSPSRHAGRTPAAPNLTLAACIHPSAALADAWSTALLVRGCAQGLTLPANLHFALRSSIAWTYSDHFTTLAHGAPP
ncbi:MAG: FAD:protein FMN transferase [Phycisphaerales bacterium]|jgi:thiamine biosynthesis lipoprotein